jgi:hypothetical protein
VTGAEVATRIRESRVLPVLALIALSAAIAAWLQHWAVQTHTWGNDEELYRHFARAIARDFPLGVFDVGGGYGRGIQRLHLLVFAFPMAFTRAPAVFDIAHLLFVIGYVSATVPAWLLARGTGLGRWTALVPASLAVAVPWAVLTTSFLTEPLGYGVFAWTLWAVWRAVVRPSVTRDALAVLLLMLAALSRTGFLLLAPLLPLAAVAQAWRFGATGASVGERLRNLPLVALRRQPIAITVGGVGMLVLACYWAGLVPGGAKQLVGTYSSSLPSIEEIVLKWRTFLSRMVAGTGFVFAAAALPWVVAQARRPRSPGAYALAATAFLASLAVLLALVNAPGDERYAMYVAFPIVVVGSVALLRAEVGPAGLVAGGLAVGGLFVLAVWRLTDTSDFGYFSFPVESAMVRVVLLRVSETLFAVLVAAAILAAAAAARVIGTARVLPLLAVPVAAWQLAMTEYILRNHVTKAGAASGADTAERAFVDRNVPAREEVGIWAVPAGEQGTYSPIWREIQYWNTAMRSVVAPRAPVSSAGNPDFPYPFGTYDLQPKLDLASGRLSWEGEQPLPRYLVVARRALAVELHWHTVAAASYIPADLVQVDQPPRARYVVDGITQDMAVESDGTATIRVYRDGAASPRCAYVDLLAPTAANPARAKPVEYVASLDGRSLHRLTLPPQGRARVFFPLRFRGRESPIRIDFAARGGIRSVDGRTLAVQLGAIELSPRSCRARIIS